MHTEIINHEDMYIYIKIIYCFITISLGTQEICKSLFYVKSFLFSAFIIPRNVALSKFYPTHFS